MDSLPVTLIVKAPNQQIEDQKIKCELSWSVVELKQHLSEVYPSRPPQHEQKLIYSGQLLKDTVVLKDILRQYEGQSTHTVHLVCTPRHIKMNIPKPVPVNENMTETNNETSNQSQPAHTHTSASTQPPLSTVPSAANRIPNITNLQWAYFNNQFDGQQISSLPLNQYQMQMMWMQQAYAQYMAQYMQMASGGVYPQIPPSQASLGNQNINAPPNDAANQQEPPQAAAPQVPAAEENPERDWLDVFYMMSRAMVLFSVVYFYSSPIRFIFVLFLGLALYLYQIGFFRNINNNNNHINNPPNTTQQEEQAPTRFMVAWTFFTTFFASLIPEIPNAI